MVQSKQTKKTELLFAHVVKHDLYLVLCSLVTATGIINKTMLVEPGTQFCNTFLSGYFDVRKFYEVRDSNDKWYEYSYCDTINCDINVTITDQCGSFAKQKCLDTGGVCKWNNNGFCSRDVVDEKSNIGVIVGASVGGAAVLIAVVIIVVVVATKKKQKKGTDSMNTEMFQATSDMDTL